MPKKETIDMPADRNTSSAVGKAFAVLRTLRRTTSALTLTGIAESVGIAPSSAHSILMQLLAEGAVLQDQDKRYQLGPAAFYIGSGFARGTRIYRSIWMELVNAANEQSVTAALAVPWEDHHLVLNSHRAGHGVAVPFGGRVPLDAASWGKVYYAWSGASLPQKLVAHTPNSITNLDDYANELERVRQLGYATDLGEFAVGAGGVCAPVTSDQGYEGLAAFVAPLEHVLELTPERLGFRIASMTARASLALGDHDRMRFFGVE